MKFNVSLLVLFSALTFPNLIRAQSSITNSADSVKLEKALPIPPAPPMVADTAKKVHETVFSNNHSLKEEMPEFPGGTRELIRYISTNIQYPQNAKKKGIQGKVVARFLVTAEGDIDTVSIIKGVDEELDNEVIRMIQSMPRWNPGKRTSVIDGKTTVTYIKTYYTLPVSFKP